MNMNIKKHLPVIGATVVSVLLPVSMVLAQVNPAGTCAPGTFNPVGIENIICRSYSIINLVIRVLMLAAVAYFIYGVIKFVIAGDAEEKGEGRTMMINGIIGLAVIIGLWGLVRILLATFGVNEGGAAPILPSF